VPRARRAWFGHAVPLPAGEIPAHFIHATRSDAMQFLLLVYIDYTEIDALPEGEYDSMMRGCFAHADELGADGCLLQSQQLEAPVTAKSVRVRNRGLSVLDGPFAETKEVLAGFNLIEAESIDEAVRIAAEFPWARTGCIEVRQVRDMDAVRRRVGASPRSDSVRQ
jgi:hypothetical protein